MDIESQLRRDEGVRKFPYTDTTGHLTIGVGRNLNVVGISDAEVDFLLKNDIASAISKLESQYAWFAGLDEVRQGVLINMTFNIGSIASFPKMLTAVQAGDYLGASVEMLNSRWADQVGDRALRLSQQMKSGEWI